MSDVYSTEQKMGAISVRPTPNAWNEFPAVDPGEVGGAKQSSSWDVFPVVKSDEVGTPEPQKPITMGDRAYDAGASAGSGLMRGVTGLLGAPSDIAELGAKGIDKIVQSLGGPERPKPMEGALHVPGSQEINEAVAPHVPEYLSPDYKPTTMAGNYIQTAGEFVPSALLGPGGVIRNVVRQAVIPGVAAEAAGQQTKGTALEPYARAAAGIGTGVGMAALARPSSADSVIRSRMSGAITPAIIQQARALMIEARQRGVNLSWPEAIEQVSPGSGLPNVQRIVEGAPSSRPAMQEFYQDRPQQIDTAGRQGIDTIALPNAAPSTVGPAVATEAEGAVNAVRDRINQTARPYYDRASTVLLTPDEMRQVRRIPGYAEARDAVRNDPQLNRYVAGLPEDSVGFLNEVKKYLDTAAENASAPVNAQRNMQRSAGYGNDARTVRDTAVNATLGNPARNYETALAIESQGRRQFLEPLLNGPLGKLAKNDITTRNAIEGLFPANPIPNSEHEITTAVRALVARRPHAAEQLVRAHIESVFNEATQNLQTGANQAGGAKFATALAGNVQQRANLRAAIEALPNGAARWNGFERLLDIFDATGRRPNMGSLTAFNAQELRGLEGGRPIEGLAKLGASPGKWLSAVNEKVGAWRLGRNLDQLARLFTDPNAGRVFERIAGMPRGAGEAQILLARLILTVGAASQSAFNKKPVN